MAVDKIITHDLPMNVAIARHYLSQELQQPEPMINLAKCALFIAQEEYPDLEPQEYLNALDTMAAEVQERLPPEPYPLRIIKTINHYLYEDLGFQGNTSDYYDPRNSFFNQVIDRRTGIPITLSLIYLEIAQRIDFPMAEVGLPGHFLIRPNVADMEIYVDPFHQGEILFKEDCQDWLSQVYGHPVSFDPALFEKIGCHRFLVRMLTNLKMIYLNQGDLLKALAAVERILLIMPNLLGELRDRGLLYYRLDRWADAYTDLNTYVANTPPDAEDQLVLRRLLDQLRQKI
jgi:regulator of sirC expression with transglutaminase-like and TPR domain